MFKKKQEIKKQKKMETMRQKLRKKQQNRTNKLKGKIHKNCDPCFAFFPHVFRLFLSACFPHFCSAFFLFSRPKR